MKSITITLSDAALTAVISALMEAENVLLNEKHDVELHDEVVEIREKLEVLEES